MTGREFGNRLEFTASMLPGVTTAQQLVGPVLSMAPLPYSTSSISLMVMIGPTAPTGC